MGGVRTTRSDEPDRISERIWLEYGDVIYDEESYNKAYNEYMGAELTIAQDTTLRKDVYKSTAPKITRAGNIEKKMRAEKAMVSGVTKQEAAKHHNYSYTAKSKEQIVFAYVQQIIRKKKPLIVYRDRKGHFVKKIS